jgi:hypothetical protein
MRLLMDELSEKTANALFDWLIKNIIEIIHDILRDFKSETDEM